jgi:hypothetical protein
VLTTLFHFGRGVAHPALGAAAEVGRDRVAYQIAKQRVPADAMGGYSPVSTVFLVSDGVLEARSPPRAIVLTAPSGHGKRRSQPRTHSATMNLRTSLFAMWQMVGVTSEPDDPMTLLLRRRFRDAWPDADVEFKLSDF